MSKGQSLQDPFLNALRRERVPVSVFLVNGIKLQGTIDVAHEGRMQSTGRNFLGSCLGHGGHVGAKVLILPGREIPNGTLITMRDDELIRTIPEQLVAGVAHVRDNGTLVPLLTSTASTTTAR